MKEQHFTVDAFQNVIRAVAGSDVEWAWVDIGCIDQRDNEQTALEVGRQAGIFKQARRPFVWLSSLCTAELARAMQDVQTYGLELRDFIDKPHSSLDLACVAGALQRTLACIFSDPWFSSLWTLQEVVLRNDAVVLSAEGEPVVWERDPLQYTFLTMLVNLCQNIYQDLEVIERRVSTAAQYAGRNEDGVTSTLRQMKDRILQAGFYYLFSDNPNVQYGTARYRMTSRRVDRVYAIMQIYNMQVGKSARPSENPGLEELVDEFAAAINRRSPTLGQMFLHTAAPERGKTWRITEQSTIPDPLMDYKEPNNLCTITLDTESSSRPVRISGKYCRFADLMEISVEAGLREGPMSYNGWGLNFRVLFDHHIQGAITTKRPRSAPKITDLRLLGTASGSPVIGHQNIRVLLLGDIRGTWIQKRHNFRRKNIGLLLHSKDRGNYEDWQLAPHERLGICMWESSEDWHDQMLVRIPWYNIDGLELH